ncbi:MAG: anaerobic ribonucleoside triphosphate reductase, partial [bacterium]|nr:anaerobic ribonucleoside triphosphate reductase [bacterium]
MIKSIVKRDGRVVLYDESKIANAILKALTAAGNSDVNTAVAISNAVAKSLEEKFGETHPGIEQIQDCVEQELMKAGQSEAATRYILYRAERTRIRETKTSLMKAIDEITKVDARISNMKRDNANIDGNTAMGSMLQIGTAGATAYNSAYLLTTEQSKAYREGDIHIHDFDFYALTTTCCQIDLLKLFHGGFSTGHGFLREPQSIGSYAALAAIAIQSNQNDQHGGQGIPNFDYAMAEGVRKTFAREYRTKLVDALEISAELADGSELADKAIMAGREKTGEAPRLETNAEAFDEAAAAVIAAELNIDKAKANRLVTNVRRRTNKATERNTYQAMEGLVHNLNTMHSRAGAQTPFSSINYGTDTTPEGRLVIRCILEAEDAGLGHGETPIFPIHIFKLKEGVNYNPEDPNYDLFKLSCRVSARRLFPNYVFLDSPFNLQYYRPGRPETEVATMGCRTRVIANVYDPDQERSDSRGNLSFTSINLPRLAIEAHGDEKKFYEGLDRMLNLVAQQLRDRFEI